MADHSSEHEGLSPGIVTIPLHNEVQGNVEVNEVDSAYNDTNSSENHESLGLSVTEYPYEHGRRYHKYLEGTYPVPNDEDEQERMDQLHHVYLLLLQGEIHLAPISNDIQRVLDLGTGTGIWAIEFADKYPSAEVIGNDLSPIQPEMVPPNCKFEVDDFEAEWLYGGRFNYIHARELGGCVADISQLCQQAYQHLVPGGFFEFQSIDPRFVSDSSGSKNATGAAEWANQLCEGMKTLGKPIDCIDQWKEGLIYAGFSEIQNRVEKIPVGRWPADTDLKSIGSFQLVQELAFVRSYTPGVFTRAFNWTQAEVDVLMAKASNDIRNPSTHLYVQAHFIWAKKA